MNIGNYDDRQQRHGRGLTRRKEEVVHAWLVLKRRHLVSGTDAPKKVGGGGQKKKKKIYVKHTKTPKHGDLRAAAAGDLRAAGTADLCRASAAYVQHARRCRQLQGACGHPLNAQSPQGRWRATFCGRPRTTSRARTTPAPAVHFTCACLFHCLQSRALWPDLL